MPPTGPPGHYTFAITYFSCFTFYNISVAQGPGGPYKTVPGTGHCAMNMYIAQNKGGDWNIIQSAEMVPPEECA